MARILGEKKQQSFKKMEKLIISIDDGANDDFKTIKILEENGLIQRFEFTIEIAWKTLRDFLVAQGYQAETSPKEVFRFAAKENIINSAEPFFNCLETRNQLSHDYSQSKFEASVKHIREDLFPHLKSLRDTLQRHL
jgi:nucleotidyltransferase substrate binding protein (TIGR01987 family)